MEEMRRHVLFLIQDKKYHWGDQSIGRGVMLIASWRNKL
jgi:hypothetical protein